MPLLTAVHLLNCNNYVFKSCEKWKSQCKIKIKITHLNFYLNKNDRKDMRKIDCIATDVWKMNTYNSIVMTYRVRDQIWSQKFAKTQRKIRWTWIMTKTLFSVIVEKIYAASMWKWELKIPWWEGWMIKIGKKCSIVFYYRWWSLNRLELLILGC